ncbi:MAG: hypothetical protein ACK4RK_05270 [Gemmataceae bacterium]
MKHFNQQLLIVTACLCHTASAWSQPRPEYLFDGCRWYWPKFHQRWSCRVGCPDDYCRKPLPGVPCNPQGCVDDYCRKPLPGVPCNPQGCVDDYCRKRCPIRWPKTCEPWYRCGPTAPCYSDLELSDSAVGLPVSPK